MRIFLCILFLLTLGAQANAQDAPAPKAKPPVEIEADNQLEWLRSENMYRGSGNVVITQGATVIRGDTAEAHYDQAGGLSALTTMQVSGNVVINDGDRVIRADHGTYDTRTEVVILTGKIITLTTPDTTVTAHDTMEYYGLENKAVARGKADIKQPNRNLKADVVTAWLASDGNRLERADAHGNVIITQYGKDGKEIAQSKKAFYNAKKNTVDLHGNVRLTRGNNHMQGDHAVIDLTTGYSTLKNSPAAAGGTGRVRAVFTSGN